MSMELIGAGLPRTGTLTQKLALEQLGLGPATTGSTCSPTSTRSRCGTARWTARRRGSRSSRAIARPSDWPGGYFYRELMDAYPDAKVLLSVREPESWERSFRETIWTMCYGESLMPLLSHARARDRPALAALPGAGRPHVLGPAGHVRRRARQPQQLIEQMHAHNEQVKRACPPSGCSCGRSTEGWEPLCEFLEVDVPDEPLPHANDRDTFLDRVIDGALDALQAWREQPPPSWPRRA